MSANKYSVAKPEMTGNELAYVTDAVKTGWVSSRGSYITKLEEGFAKYIGTKYAVASSSGTTALTLALSALGIGEGDEVIVPEFTMVASAWAVSYVGATPVFVDCGADMNIDVERIERAITPRTKAIMPVHIYGRPADMKAVMKLAYEYNLFVVEDACEAHGATIDGKRVGSFGDIGCFSLFGNKIITSGEGGLITTDNEKVYLQLKHYREMAHDENHTFLHKKMAYNFRMTNLQAAVAFAQLERIDEFLAKRRQIADWYDESLKQLTVPRPEGSVVWYYDILLSDEEERDSVQRYLADDGIETRMFFKPMSMQPMYYDEKYARTLAMGFSKRGIYLPTYVSLTKDDVSYIAEKVIESRKYA